MMEHFTVLNAIFSLKILIDQKTACHATAGHNPRDSSQSIFALHSISR